MHKKAEITRKNYLLLTKKVLFFIAKSWYYYPIKGRISSFTILGYYRKEASIL